MNFFKRFPVILVFVAISFFTATSHAANVTKTACEVIDSMDVAVFTIQPPFALLKKGRPAALNCPAIFEGYGKLVSANDASFQRKVLLSSSFSSQWCTYSGIESAESIICSTKKNLFMAPQRLDTITALQNVIPMATSEAHTILIGNTGVNDIGATVKTLARTEEFILKEVEEPAQKRFVLDCNVNQPDLDDKINQSVLRMLEQGSYKNFVFHIQCQSVRLFKLSDNKIYVETAGDTKEIVLKNAVSFASKLASISQPVDKFAFEAAAYLSCEEDEFKVISSILARHLIKSIAMAPNPIIESQCI